MSEPEVIGENRDEAGRFIKGVSGNPNGRPKGTFSLVEMIKNKLQETPEGLTKTNADIFIDTLMKKAIQDGDVTLMKDMIDRVDGKAKQSMDHTTQGDKIMFLPMEILEKNNIDSVDN